MASKNNQTAAKDYYDLGTYSRTITTTSGDAQTWFTRGLVWNYAFNHEESVRCFERALAADPDCAIAYWGVAYSLGPNYNKPWGGFEERELARNLEKARAALLQARSKSDLHTSAVERRLIDALWQRYPQHGSPEEEGDAWNHGFAAAMQAAYAEHPDDPDVISVYADALMNLTPWRLWDLDTGEPAPGARTLDARAALESGLVKHPHHPGLLHLYIHLMEMSPRPEQALNAADRLRDVVPDAGHLNHMPTHIDMLCGDYRRAIASNTRAIIADDKLAARDGTLIRDFYSLYRAHNYHFRIYAAMMAGLSSVALESAIQLDAALPEGLLRIESPPMADWLEGFLSMRVHVLVRFGMWQELINLELPADTNLYCTTAAMIEYGKGVAFAATGKLDQADKHREVFDKLTKKVPTSRTIFNNTCVDILAIASAMLDGEIEYRRGNFDEAFAKLRLAIKLDDELPYDEPWGWMQPTRHAYGALLLEQGKVNEAAQVYSADLGFDGVLPRALQHRNNVWALHGYHECLVRLGRDAEARIVDSQLKIALAVADVPVKASCFCRGLARGLD